MTDAPITLAPGPHGVRVVTTRAVAPGALLLVLEGTLVSTPGRHTLQVGEALHLASPDAAWRFIDHACEPNARIELGGGPGHARLRALAPLGPGEPVTFNYLTTEWDMATPFECRCGARTCAGRIAGARHLSRAALETLGPLLAPHLRARLEAGYSPMEG